MSHDWPVDITQYGDVAGLLKHKPFFRSDIEKGELGSPPMMDLLRSLRPSYWFSAHLHCKFEALVNHEPETSESSAPSLGQTSVPAESNPKSNPDEILIEDDENDTDSGPASATQANSSDVVQSAIAESAQPPARRSTRFLALDKCLPRRQYLHVLDLGPATPGSGLGTIPPTLTYDREWLAISRALHPFLSTERHQPALPPLWDLAPIIQESQRWVDENVGEREIRHIQEFTMTAPGPVNTNPRPARNIRQRTFLRAIVLIIIDRLWISPLVYEPTNRGILLDAGTRE
ncbi:RNA lariat debranching enzyme [Rhizoctonia solani]|uniref:RNA lariat debranching enzyme n=1 Tax=Rhizoctonia solani TaxID=456999 RepID=A0A8H8ST14_9AGAM|nr:RNA lariat debranching enzyme [Rhizoctonia solani]QRW17124.1 RNA lariat debranching enzyme [Rhizoctonia solani]